MKQSLKKKIKTLFFIANIACIIMVLLGILAPYVDPVKWWPSAIAGLLFPVFLIILFLFALAWLFIQPRRSVYSFVMLLLSIPAIYVTFGVNIFSSYKQGHKPENIRVLTWNVGLMNYNEVDTFIVKRNNAIIFDKLERSGADVICLQEFFTGIGQNQAHNLMNYFSKKANYPYYYFSRDMPKMNGNFYSGSIIFSRYKIVDSTKNIFPLKGFYFGSIIRTGILIKNDTIDIFNTRLQLMKFQGKEYQQMHEIKVGSKTVENSLSILGKLRYGYGFLSQQAEFVKAVLDSSNRPTILAADLNNIPLSYTYGKVKGNMNDAWASVGKGFGRTFDRISPSLRMDYLFYDDHFKAIQINRILQEGETDHHGLLLDIRLKTK